MTVRSRGRDGGADTAPLFPSAGNPALMADGTGASFRRLLADLLTLSVRLDAVRSAFGARLGVSGPQYMVLMAVAQHHKGGGIAVGQVADALHVTGAFVTAEAGKLVKSGLVQKWPNPSDRRGVLLRLTEAGVARLTALAPHIQAVNDRFFGALGAADFKRLCALAAGLVADSEAALALAEAGADSARRAA